MEVILLSLNVTVLIDRKMNILEVRWNGIVPLEDCTEALHVVKSNVREMYDIVINRSEFVEFTPEARKWIKSTFLKKEVMDIIPFVSKIAQVESSRSSNLFSMFINQLVSLMIPGLMTKSFDSLSEAIKWLGHGKPNLNSSWKKFENPNLYKELKKAGKAVLNLANIFGTYPMV